MSAEIIAINQGSKKLDADFVSERENSSMYLVNDDHEKGVEIERRLEDKFPTYRLQSYRTPGILLESHFRSYFVTRPDFPVPGASLTESDIDKVAAKEFIETTTKEARPGEQTQICRAVFQWPLDRLYLPGCRIHPGIYR
jgi:hypothetical protein